MHRWVGICLAIALPPALGGCATSLNLDGDSRVYGGVALDARKCREFLAPAPPQRPDKPDTTAPGWRLLAGVYALADLPLSLIGDTLTLPITIPTALEEREDDEPAVRPGPLQGGSAANRKYLSDLYADSPARR
jgi:uncharacterized protein YceK